MSIRHDNINSHITAHPAFEGVMKALAEMYATCPDASHLRFRQALEDQMKVNIQSRGRVSGGSSGEGNGWRDLQKAEFAGRGAKWVKLTGRLLRHLNEQLDEWAEMGEDVDSYRSFITNAGFGWVRYSGPRGTAAEPQLAFEVRIGGSKIDHPKHLFKVSQLLWDQKADQHSVLGGTPFGMNLEVATPSAPVEDSGEETTES